MEEYVLFIDDTAFATNEKHFETLKSEECCFCSVAINKKLIPALNGYMKEKTDKLFEKYGTREFHFTDMYNRRGDFSGIKIEETLDIVESFAKDVVDCGMLITVSTINKHSYVDPLQVKIMDNVKKYVLPNVNLPVDNKSMNLILSIIRSNVELKKAFDCDVKISEVICDEGIRKNGNSFQICLEDENIDVKFDSSTNPLLQFADFAAWFVTRVKHILDKHPQKVKDWEKELLLIYSTLPFSNMGQTEYVINSEEPYDYDKSIDDYMKKQKS